MFFILFILKKIINSIQHNIFFFYENPKKLFSETVFHNSFQKQQSNPPYFFRPFKSGEWKGKFLNSKLTS